MAHHRLSPVTHNMYEVISEIYRIVKKTLHMVRRKQRSVVQVHERRRFRWRQLKNIFIMMVTQNWEVVSTRDAFKIKAWISPLVDAIYSMIEVERTQVFDTRFDPSWLFKTQDMNGVSRASCHITIERPVLIRGWYTYKFMQCMLWVYLYKYPNSYISVDVTSRHNEFFHRYYI